MAAVWVDALPLPTLREGHLKHPIAQAEVARWTTLLQSIGVSMTEAELMEKGLAVGAMSITLQNALMRPLKPIQSVTKTGQSWGLFAYPDPFAGRLVVMGRREGDWQPVWAAPQRDGTPLSRVLRYRRIRGIYDDFGDRPQPRAIYGRFSDWVAQLVLDEHPDWQQVQIRLDLVTVHLPHEGAEPPEQRRHVRLRSRSQLAQKAEQRLESLREASP